MNHLCYLSIEHSHSPPVAVERKRREERERLVSFLEFYGDEFTLKLEIINENTTQVLSESRHFVRGPWTRAFVTSLFTSQQQTAWNTHRSRSKYPLWITRTFFTVVIYLTLLTVFGVEQRLGGVTVSVRLPAGLYHMDSRSAMRLRFWNFNYLIN